ncbi:MAG TPA: FAD binding domain-containing protein [Pseudonocardia sp.]|nr:FAD binding domain-containing protein [Pseudonocardia sp.]
MRPPPFAYARPRSVAETVTLLAAHGDAAALLAGGQSLVPALNRRAVRPGVLVDLSRVQDLRHVRLDGESLSVGALTTHADLARLRDPHVRSRYGVLPRTAPLVAHHPIRTRGTFGGSIAHADPVAEWCVLAVLLDARIEIEGPGGPRTVPAGEFFRGAHRTALTTGEVVVSVRFPEPAPRAALVEHSVRAGDYAVALGAVAVEVADGRIARARVAVGGVADRPLRLPAVEQELAGMAVVAGPAAVARRAAATSLAGHATGTRYRADVAASMVGRALTAALAGPGGGNP